jgi:hypothetical protein
MFKKDFFLNYIHEQKMRERELNFKTSILFELICQQVTASLKKDFWRFLNLNLCIWKILR